MLKEDGVILMVSLNDTYQHVRAKQLYRYEIFTCTKDFVNCSDLNISKTNTITNPLYCNINSNGIIQLIADFDSELLLRIICEDRIKGNDAYTFLVCRTKSQPLCDSQKENLIIHQYINKERYLVNWL